MIKDNSAFIINSKFSIDIIYRPIVKNNIILLLKKCGKQSKDENFKCYSKSYFIFNGLPYFSGYLQCLYCL